MFRFFRKLRQELLIENRFRKYTQYAVGEILLVVIGILIALQVNTWNEERKNTSDLRIALQTLSTEIETNKSYLDRQVNRIESGLDNIEYFMHELNAPDQSTVPDSVITELIRNIATFTLTPLRRNAYGNLINSGAINHVRNDTLKLDLIGIERGYQIFTRVRNDMSGLWTETIRPYYLKNANIISFIDTLHQKPVPDTYYPDKREAFINNRELNNILTARTISLQMAKENFEIISRWLGEINESVEAYLEKN